MKFLWIKKYYLLTQYGRISVKKQPNLIGRNMNDIQKGISDYLDDVYERTREKIRKYETQSRNHPSKQHMVSEFILRRIAADDPTRASQKLAKGLQLQEHKIWFNPRKKKITFRLGRTFAPSEYSRKNNIYNSPSFEHEFFLEHMFSCIEEDAARLIDSQIATNYDLNRSHQIDPYDFSLARFAEGEASPDKVTARIRLSAFFAIQFLRPEARRESLHELLSKYEFESGDLASNIKKFLSSTILEIYCRQWFWVRVPEHEMFISETGLTTISTCTRAASVMPVSRRDFIYFNEIPNSHLSLDDKTIYSTSSIIYRWYASSVSEMMISLESTTLENNNDEMKFVSNLKAEFNHEVFITPEGCCFSCTLKPISLAPTNNLFILSDLPKR